MESGHVLLILRSLILISAANGAPVLLARLLGTRFARPIDGGIVLRDGSSALVQNSDMADSPRLLSIDRRAAQVFLAPVACSASWR